MMYVHTIKFEIKSSERAFEVFQKIKFWDLTRLTEHDSFFLSWSKFLSLNKG